ncbi:hypothetical protein [Sorangium sp. So ce131]|uniref:hypothetical protein n=1 Tax=Sorangium sp. So ce131 TaxID=3133282 RepID=UPI003F5F2B9A
MRGCRTTWLFGGLALALSAPALLAGCAIAPGERDEDGDAWGELDPATSEEASGLSDDGAGVDADHVVGVPLREGARPATLLQRAAGKAPGTEGPLGTTTYVRSGDSHLPEPLPWHGQDGTNGRDHASPESDGTR